MKKIWKRLLAGLFGLVMLLGTLNLNGLTVRAESAADKAAESYPEYVVTEVSTMQAFRQAMEDSESRYIIVTANIEETTASLSTGDPNYDRYADAQYEKWETVKVGGKKVLDLNGHAVSVTDKSNWMRLKNEDCYTTDYGAKGMFCTVPKGTELTVNDSEGGGSVYYDGYMVGANAPGAFGGTALDYYADVCTRDLFAVSGTMVVNGGNFYAGRSKKQWIVFMAPSQYVQQVIMGTPITVRDGGTAILNGGHFRGLGSEKPENSSVRRAETVRVNKGGRLRIFDGQYEAEWGANLFGYTVGEADIQVFGGLFALKSCDRKVRVANDKGITSATDNGMGTGLPDTPETYPYPVDFKGYAMAQPHLKGPGLTLSDLPSAFVVTVSLKENSVPSYLYQNGKKVNEIYYKMGDSDPKKSTVQVMDAEGQAFSGLSGLSRSRGSKVEYGWTLYTYNKQFEKWSKIRSFDDKRIEGHETEPELNLREAEKLLRFGKVYQLVCTTHEFTAGGKELVHESAPVKISLMKNNHNLIKTELDSALELGVGATYNFRFSLYRIDDENLVKSSDPTWSEFLGYFDPDGKFHMVREKSGNVGIERSNDGTGKAWSLISENITFDKPGKYIVREAAQVYYTDYSTKIGNLYATNSIDCEFRDIVVEVTNPHVWVLLLDKSTCQKEGTRYYLCTECLKLRADSVPAQACKAGDALYHDDENCWGQCIWCNEPCEITPHELTVTGTEETCDGTAVHMQCTRCQAEVTKTKLATPQHLLSVDLTTTLFASGTGHLWTVGEHNGYQGDSRYHWHTCKTCGTVEKKGHEWSDGVCKVCGYEQCELGIVGTGCIHNGRAEVVLVADHGNEVSAAFKAGAVKYEWYRDGESKPFATTKSVTFSKADVGHYITCEVTMNLTGEVWYADYPVQITEPAYIDIAGTEATCFKDGVKAHKQCTKCGEYFDASGNALESAVIPKTENHVYDNACDVECNVCGFTREVKHTVGTEWKIDKDVHYKECTACGIRLNESGHTAGEMKAESGKKCDEVRKLTGACTVCGETLMDTEIKSHLFGDWEITPATCQTTGLEKNTCKDCKTVEEIELPKADHLIVSVPETLPSHTTPGLKAHYECAYCGELFGDVKGSVLAENMEIPVEKNEHVYMLAADENGHFKACECGEKTGAEAHTFTEWVLTEATHTKAGYRYRTCTACDYMEMEETEALADHEFDTGADTRNHFEVCECGEIRNKEAHRFENGICTVCGFSKPGSAFLWLLRQWWFYVTLALVLGGGVAGFLFWKKKKKAVLEK